MVFEFLLALIISSAIERVLLHTATTLVSAQGWSTAVLRYLLTARLVPPNRRCLNWEPAISLLLLSQAPYQPLHLHLDSCFPLALLPRNVAGFPLIKFNGDRQQGSHHYCHLLYSAAEPLLQHFQQPHLIFLQQL